MNTTLTAKNEPSARLNCRVSLRIKQRAEEAAAILGQSITSFTEAALNEKTEAVLDQAYKIQLSERDFERFISAIDSSKTPTAELTAAMKDYEHQRDLEPKGNW